MKTKELKEFQALFALTPSITILDCNIDNNPITNILNSLVKPSDGKITTIKTSDINELRVKAKRSTYDYGIISNLILDHNDKHKLMTIISKAIRDSGYIIILEDKKKDFSVLYELLEEFDYGAVGTIDIFENYNLIMGMKVHMWGMD